MATQSLTTNTAIFGPGDAGRIVSAEEFASAAFIEPWRYERVEGRLVVMSPDGEAHDDSSEPVRDYLGAYRLKRPDVVQKVVSEAWVRVEGGTDRIGDIGVYLVGERAKESRPARVPELMFEVVSPGRESEERDYLQKRSEYHRLGVLEYVIIDRFARELTVFAYQPDGYQQRVLTRSETYTSPLLPGLAIPLDEIL
jgi:Uma2 family endonuclease